jgi:hypothetical protein
VIEVIGVVGALAPVEMMMRRPRQSLRTDQDQAITRPLLAWRLLNSLTADCRIEAVEEVTACYAAPEIFNTDQGTIHKLRVRRLAFIELSRASP